MEFFDGVITQTIGYETGMIVAIVLLGVWVVYTAWLTVSMRCPNCQLKLIPFSLTKHAKPKGIKFITSAEHCPVCGL